LLIRGMGRVCGDLAAIGYDAEWDVISTCAFGAPHTRERVFLVAYPKRQQKGPGEEPHGSAPRFWLQGAAHAGECRGSGWGPWAAESGVARVAYGVPSRMDRQRGIGNAVCPVIAEWLGRRILEAEEGLRVA
jgi:DNA (cytosine-5)-methyltransferase 1